MNQKLGDGEWRGDCITLEIRGRERSAEGTKGDIAEKDEGQRERGK